MNAHEERVRRAKASARQRNTEPSRWSRQAPNSSRQYANPMSTEAARDDRLTPQAKSLLQVIRARCGKKGWTESTKTTLARVMSRSARSIQRYIGELVRFGYIRTSIRKGPRGLYTGMVIEICGKVLPYWTDIARLATDLATKMASTWTDVRVFSEETELSPKNLSQNPTPTFQISEERDKRSQLNFLRAIRP